MFGTWEGCFVCLFVCLFVVFQYYIFVSIHNGKKIFDLLNQKK